MAETSNIEWTDATFNPWIGCTRVSPACDDCYAARSTPARTLGVVWGAGEARRRTSESNWKLPIQWERDHAAFFAEHGRRRRVFCASLADVFDNEVDPAWRAELFALIAGTPNLSWLLLTKRISNVAKMIEAPGMQKCGLPPNVWLGATVVNQAEADRDIPKLLAVPARVRFLSIEPMLSDIDITPFLWGKHEGVDTICQNCPRDADCECGYFTRTAMKLASIDWVIVGGESGPKARPMHPDWARDLRDQCAAAGVPLLFKQWGEWKPISQMDEAEHGSLYKSRVTARSHESQINLDDIYGKACAVSFGVVHLDGSTHDIAEPMSFLQGTGAMQTFKLGKKAAGRLLDGVEHNGYPEVSHG